MKSRDRAYGATGGINKEEWDAKLLSMSTSDHPLWSTMVVSVIYVLNKQLGCLCLLAVVTRALIHPPPTSLLPPSPPTLPLICDTCDIPTCLKNVTNWYFRNTKCDSMVGYFCKSSHKYVTVVHILHVIIYLCLLQVVYITKH